MKNFNKLITFVLLSGMFFTACIQDKNDDLNNQQQSEQIIISTEDHTTAEDLYQNVEDQVDEAIETRGGGGDCPIVTANPDWQTYPRTVTIDFGDGCEGADGRTRRGQIVVEITDNIINTNASRTTSFVNFYIYDIKLEGSHTWKNEGYDAQGNITLSRTVVGGRITYPDGASAIWQSSGLLTQTAGGQTPLNFFDNVFEITGTANGVSREGFAFQVVIEEALVKDKICPWLVSGVITLTVDNVDVSVDYGNGNCDRKAILTLPNGTEHEIFI